MITWLFDKRNRWGYIPNLVKRTDIKPGSQEWWDLAITPPFSYEFRFLKYCGMEGVKWDAKLINDEIWSGPAYYPIKLNFWAPEIDYFEHMDPQSLLKLKQGLFKVLFYYDEGDDPTIDLLPHLREMIKRHGLSLNNIKIATANWNLDGKAPFVYIADDELYYRYLHLMRKHPDWVEEVNLDRREKITTCLTRADKVWRRVFGACFTDLGLHDNSYYSYNNYQYEMYSVDEDSMKPWADHVPNLGRKMAAFELQLPIKCDNLSDSDHNNHGIINLEHHSNAYWNVVVETHFDQHTTFLTEKTFKPILNLQPFIIVGNPKSLALLKHLGYKTFDGVLNEGYDKIINHQQRMDEVLKACYVMHNTSHAQHQRIQKNIKSILEYNQRQFLAPKAGRLKQFLSQLEY
jgi:hypothetical protein